MYFGTVHPPRLKDVRKIAARKRQSVDIAPVGFMVGRSRLHVDLQLHHVDGRAYSSTAFIISLILSFTGIYFMYSKCKF